MRLGAYPCKLLAGSLAHRLYGQDMVIERHRHRYEINNSFRKNLREATGCHLDFEDADLVEMAELKIILYDWISITPRILVTPSPPSSTVLWLYRSQ